MKKPKIDSQCHSRLALLAQSSAVGVDIKAALEYMSELEVYITVHDKFIQDLTSRLNISGKDQKKQINKIRRGIERYEEQHVEFIESAMNNMFDDYLKEKS